MRIGIVSTRLAGVDGVTFEATKWEAALERIGHEVRLCAGEVDALRASARLIPPMHFAWPPDARVQVKPADARRNVTALSPWRLGSCLAGQGQQQASRRKYRHDAGWYPHTQVGAIRR